MADASQGEGWWLASDHRWYPPELHSDATYRALHAEEEPATLDRHGTSNGNHVASGDAIAHDLFDERPAEEKAIFEPTRSRSRAWLGLVAVGVVALGALGFIVLQRDTDSTSPSATPLGAGTDSTGAATDTAATDIPGSYATPAQFGEISSWPEWNAGIVEVFDAAEAEALSEFAEPPPPDTTFLAVVYEVTYTGPEISSYDPVVVSVQGSQIYEPFACFLEPSALAAQDIFVGSYELLAGQRTRLADCFAVPSDEVDQLLFTLDNFQIYDADEVVYAPTGAKLPDPEPITAAPDYASLDLLDTGTEITWGDWTASVTGLVDPGDEELLSQFVEPARDGYRYLLVAFDVTYTGQVSPASIEVYPTVLGDAVYTTGNCILDSAALDRVGIEFAFEIDAGATVSLGQCVEVPVDTATLVVRLENFADFDNEPVFYTVDTP